MSLLNPDHAAGLTINLLGPFDVRVCGATLRPLRTSRGRLLLALLALRHGREVDRAWLAGTLWPESDDSRAAYNLRRTLSDLRAALGPEASRIAAPSAHTLRLDISGAAVDLVEFDRRIAQKDIESLREAVQLCRGLLLEGFTETWVNPEREQREVALLNALDTLADAALSTGDVHEAVALLRRAIAIDPYRERSHNALMRALACAGDTAGAEKVYRSLRTRLHRDLNAGPGPETVRTYAELRQTSTGDGRLADARPEDARRGELLIRLPQPLTALVGRRREVQKTLALLEANRLIVLAGPGGIGKTRLAIASALAAARFPDGVVFADLAPLERGAPIYHVLSSALGITVQAEDETLTTILNALENRQMLLLLDNCEHVTSQCAEAALRILEGCPRVKIVATSRQSLGLPGEAVYRVGPMSLPSPRDDRLPNRANSDPPEATTESDAVNLFVERVRQSGGPDLTNASDLALAGDICRRLEGVPLAIELAAARARSSSLERILDRLDGRLSFLTSGSAALGRQSTLRTTLDWSYDLLTPSEQRALRLLSVFSGSFSPAAAAHVIGSDRAEGASADDTLDVLVDRSLVSVDSSGGSGNRYYLLDTIREYGRERIDLKSEKAEARTRLADFFLRLVDEAAPHLRGPARWERTARLEIDAHNLRDALRWLTSEHTSSGGTYRRDSLRFVGALKPYWILSSRFREGALLAEAALADGSGQVWPETAAALECLGALRNRLGDYDESVRLLERAAAIRRETGDPLGLAQALVELGASQAMSGRYEDARRNLQSALPHLRTYGDALGEALAYSLLGVIAKNEGAFEEAARHFDLALRLVRQQGDLPQEGAILHNLGNLDRDGGGPERADDFYRQSLAIHRAIGRRSWQALNLYELANNAVGRGELEESMELFGEALDIATSVGDSFIACGCKVGMANVLIMTGDVEQARCLTEQAIAEQHRRGIRRELAYSLHCGARIALSEGDTRRSAVLLGAAERIRQDIGAPFTPGDEKACADLLQQLVQSADKDSIIAALETGRGFTQDEAAAFALSRPPEAGL